MVNLIKCFSDVQGHKEAIDLVNELNSMKTSLSEDFYIEYDKNQDYNENDSYRVVGNVCDADWEDLNMDVDFMVVDIL